MERPAGLELRIERGGRILVPRDGGAPSVVERFPGEVPGLLAAALEGPAAVLGLALGGRFCLHCSAVWTAAGAVLLSGPSGAGKSTLAAALNERGMPRLADDLLPLGLVEGRPHCFPHFHQPRLGPEEQVGPEVPEAVPVAAAFFLDAALPPGETRPLAAAEAVLALARATAAVTLFPPPVHARHQELCAALAATAPPELAGYPHRPGAVSAIERLIRGRFS